MILGPNGSLSFFGGTNLFWEAHDILSCIQSFKTQNRIIHSLFCIVSSRTQFEEKGIKVRLAF